MHFNGPIVRPQTDADSLFIEVTVGCSHNKCTFCNFYHGYPFRVAPLEQIEEDLIEASRRYPGARKIWANGGNPYALSADKLAKAGELILKYFPDARISTYARVDDLNRKTVEEMRMLKELGFKDLVVGFECGDDDVLKKVNKGYTSEDILEGCRKLEEAGVDYRMIFLGGLAGKGKLRESALRTAAVLNQLHPYIMYLNTVSVLPGTQLYEERMAGEFVEAGEKESIYEFITLLENMENEIAIFAAPNTTPFSFFVDLQKSKTNLLAQMKAFADSISDAEEIEMGERRHSVRSV